MIGGDPVARIPLGADPEAAVLVLEMVGVEWSHRGVYGAVDARLVRQEATVRLYVETCGGVAFRPAELSMPLSDAVRLGLTLGSKGEEWRA